MQSDTPKETQEGGTPLPDFVRETELETELGTEPEDQKTF